MASNLDKAFALAREGFYVFPCNPRNKKPITEHGFLDSTLDAEQIATWWGANPNALVGVWAGGSGVVCLDIDVKPEDGINGFDALGFYEIESTFSYTSTNGLGKHFLYKLDKPIHVWNAYRGMVGVDRRSGGSYYIHMSGDVPRRDELADPPEWLLEESDGTKSAFRQGFAGGIQDWLEQFSEDEEPTQRVIDFVDRIPTGNEINHQSIVERTYELVRLGAEGHTGIVWAFDQMIGKWLVGEWGGMDEKREVYTAVEGAIKKAGAADHEIATLPKYEDVIKKASPSLATQTFGALKEKPHVFRVAERALDEGFSISEAVALVFGAPTTSLNARNMGYAYIESQLSGYVRNDEMVPYHQDREYDTTLLTDQEREAVEKDDNFINFYLEQARKALGGRINEPINRDRAWTLLGLWYAGRGHIPDKAGGHQSLCTYHFAIADTTSGKSDAVKLTRLVVERGFTVNPRVSPNATDSALTNALIARDYEPVWLFSDEGHKEVRNWTSDSGKSPYSGMLEMLAEMYDQGSVSAKERATDKENSGKSAHVYPMLDLIGTPRDMTEPLTKKNFTSGFLPRVQWAIGDPRNITYESLEDYGVEGENDDDPFDGKDFAGAICERLGPTPDWLELRSTRPVLLTKEAQKRLQDAKWKLADGFQDHPEAEIILPSLVRMGNAIRRIASTLAINEGSFVVNERQMIIAMYQAEIWVKNLLQIVKMVSESEFSLQCDRIEQFIMSNGGQVTTTRLNRYLSGYYPRDILAFKESLVSQGRITETGTTVSIRKGTE